jgi:hypothetical protein
VTAQPELHLITKQRFCDLFCLEQHQVINVHWSNDSTGSSPLCFRFNAHSTPTHSLLFVQQYACDGISTQYCHWAAAT